MYTLNEVFYEAVALKRPHGSFEEASLVAWLASEFEADLIDGAGNLHFDRRYGTSKTLFTAHTDTVHYTGGTNKFDVEVKGETTTVCADGDVLGADDASGLAILAHMMESGTPGYYIFFRGEEVGGIGSSWLAQEMPDLLKQFDRAIAFDRAGYYDVITHQAGGRCCSDAFADALAEALNGKDESFMFCADSTGIYTDTAEFTSLIPECTNLSVGYFAQHTSRECQDMTFLEKLARACTTIAWEALPTKRDTTEEEDPYKVDNSIFLADELVYSLYEAYDGNPAELEDILAFEYGEPTPLEFHDVSMEFLKEVEEIAYRDYSKALQKCYTLVKDSVYEY